MYRKKKIKENRGCESYSSWKNAKVSALFKKDDETDKQKYRPISLLWVPEKQIEQAVATTITNRISKDSPSHSHQWAYKNGH